MIPESVSTAELCELFNVHRSTVARWVKSGLLVRRSHGQFDFVAAVRGYAKLVAAKDGSEPTVATQVGSERARLLKAQADRAEMQLAVERKELVPFSEGAACAVTLTHIFRAGVLAFKSRLAGRLSLREGAEIVYSEGCALLQEISDMDVYSERLLDVAREGIERELAKGDIAAPFVRAGAGRST
jgi:hypothetical protein